MKRWLAAAVLACALGCSVFAQERTEPGGVGAKTEEHEPEMSGWLWINFAILVVGLGYLISKSAPALFRAREEDIRGGINEAERKKADADARAAEIDRRLAGLTGEIGSIRDGVLAEMSTESHRILQETERLVQRIEEQAQQEIGFITKAASQQLRAYSADLALDLAKERVQRRMNPETQHELVSDYISGLRHA